ncbi:hypothetical protein V6N11_011846 [Hibiscus sabdariffa]|uniref:Uncharacterized protein n=1 Tax=Hibiscus sabdariffa TaxID=183260 RepID=A0ABR2S9F9_9ROSI
MTKRGSVWRLSCNSRVKTCKLSTGQKPAPCEEAARDATRYPKPFASVVTRVQPGAQSVCPSNVSFLYFLVKSISRIAIYKGETFSKGSGHWKCRHV